MQMPYIGITGFMSSNDALCVLETVPANSNRLVMIGVLASLKTRRGIPNKYPNRYPAINKIADIFPKHPSTLNLIPYNAGEYAEVVDYVLLDHSGGHGKPFNPECAHNYLRELKTKNPGIMLGVAGGLSPTTLNLVKPLIREFPNLSIDAESNLRTHTDHMDLACSRL